MVEVHGAVEPLQGTSINNKQADMHIGHSVQIQA